MSDFSVMFSILLKYSSHRKENSQIFFYLNCSLRQKLDLRKSRLLLVDRKTVSLKLVNFSS